VPSTPPLIVTFAFINILSVEWSYCFNPYSTGRYSVSKQSYSHAVVNYLLHTIVH
jgi:hypothetical protein